MRHICAAISIGQALAFNDTQDCLDGIFCVVRALEVRRVLNELGALNLELLRVFFGYCR